MRFIPLAKLINLHDGYRRRIKIDELDLLLIQEDGQLHIIDNRCPHRGHPLERGDVLDQQIFCPQHGFAFSLEDGRCDAESCPKLNIYQPVYEGTEVGIAVARA